MEVQAIYSLKDDIGTQVVNEELIKFLTGFEGDCYTTMYVAPVSQSRLKMIDMAVAALRSVLPDEAPVVRNFYPTTIRTKSIYLTLADGMRDLWEETKLNRNISFHLFGAQDTILRIMTILKNTVPQITTPVLTWEFIAAGQRRSHNVLLEPAKKIHTEFYPWIENVVEYFDEYLASDENILILLGETGTGKTSFIRSLIWHGMLSTTFTYEQELFNTDEMFVNFIVDANKTLLVIEDADLLLTNREHDGNKVMSKFLNVSDGLASGLGRKKIIFTANITELNRIDTALLRVGRCFDCQLFRRLTEEETKAAARAAGITAPITGGHTLAELFSLTRKPRKRAAIRIGFAL